MKKYFYSNGKEKQGPFSFEELKNKDIKKETLIWFQGLEDWKPAEEIKEIGEILELIPPPIIFDSVITNTKKYYIGTLLIIMIYFFVKTIYSNNQISFDIFIFTLILSQVFGLLSISVIFYLVETILFKRKKSFPQFLFYTNLLLIILLIIGDVVPENWFKLNV